MKPRSEGELKVVAFKTDDLRHMTLMDKRIEITDTYVNAFGDVLEGQATKESYTAIGEDGNSVFSFGGWMMRPEVIDIWFVASVRIIRYPKTCFGICWDYIERICFKKYGVKRVQALVRCGWKVAEQFMFRLGFQIEGRLRFPDNDYYIFARLK